MLMQQRNHTAKTLLLCLVCTFFWGAGYPVLKLSYTHWAIAGADVAGKLLFAGIRFLLAGTFLWVFAALRHRRIVLPEKKALPKTALLGICQTTLQYGLLYIGLANTSGSKGSVLNQICIFLTVLLTPLFFKSEKLTLRKILGCVLGFGGIVAMNLTGLSFQLEFGDGIVLLSSCCAAAGYLISKGMPKGSDALISTAYQQLFGGLILLAAGLVTGGELNQVNWPGVGCLAFSVLAAAVAYSIWFYLLQHNDAGKVSVYKFMTPIFGVLFSGLLLEEPVWTPENGIALTLVCVGIIVVNGKRSVKKLKEEKV